MFGCAYKIRNAKDLEALQLPTNAAIDDLVVSRSPRPPVIWVVSFVSRTGR